MVHASFQPSAAPPPLPWPELFGLRQEVAQLKQQILEIQRLDDEHYQRLYGDIDALKNMVLAEKQATLAAQQLLAQEFSQRQEAQAAESKANRDLLELKVDLEQTKQLTAKLESDLVQERQQTIAAEHRAEHALAAIASASVELQACQKRLSSTEAQLSQANEQAEQLRVRASWLESDLGQSRKAEADLKLMVTQLEGQLDQAKQELAKSKRDDGQRSALEKKLMAVKEAAAAQAAKAKVQVQVFADKVIEVQEKYEQAKRQTACLEEKLITLRSQSEQVGQKEAAAVQRADGAQAALNRAKEEVKAKQRQISQLNEQLGAVQQQESQLQQQVQRLQSDLAAAQQAGQERAELQQQVQRLQSDLAAAQQAGQERAELQQQVQRLQSDLAAAQQAGQERAELQQQLQRLQSDLAAAQQAGQERAELQQQLQQLQALVTDAKQDEHAWEARETELRSKAQALEAQLVASAALASVPLPSQSSWPQEGTAADQQQQGQGAQLPQPLVYQRVLVLQSKLKEALQTAMDWKQKALKLFALHQTAEQNWQSGKQSLAAEFQLYKRREEDARQQLREQVARLEKALTVAQQQQQQRLGEHAVLKQQILELERKNQELESTCGRAGQALMVLQRRLGDSNAELAAAKAESAEAKAALAESKAQQDAHDAVEGVLRHQVLELEGRLSQANEMLVGMAEVAQLMCHQEGGVGSQLLQSQQQDSKTDVKTEGLCMASTPPSPLYTDTTAPVEEKDHYVWPTAPRNSSDDGRMSVGEKRPRYGEEEEEEYGATVCGSDMSDLGGHPNDESMRGMLEGRVSPAGRINGCRKCAFFKGLAMRAAGHTCPCDVEFPGQTIPPNFAGMSAKRLLLRFHKKHGVQVQLPAWIV